MKKASLRTKKSCLKPSEERQALASPVLHPPRDRTTHNLKIMVSTLCKFNVESIGSEFLFRSLVIFFVCTSWRDKHPSDAVILRPILLLAVAIAVM